MSLLIRRVGELAGFIAHSVHVQISVRPANIYDKVGQTFSEPMSFARR